MDKRPINAPEMQPEEKRQDLTFSNTPQHETNCIFRSTTSALFDQSSLAASFRPYQKFSAQQLLERRRMILGLPMGSGKTYVAIVADALSRILHEPVASSAVASPTLIICPKSATAVWISEILKWLPETPSSNIVLVRGTAPKRHKIWDAIKFDRVAGVDSEKPIFVLCTYGVMLRDKKIMPQKWITIIADEAHALKNMKTLTFKTFKKLRSEFIYLVTGTPASRGPQDMWTLLHIINRTVFPSYWRFIYSWCDVHDGQFGKEIIGAKNVKNLREMLKKYMVYIKEEDLAGELPELNRYSTPIELEGKQLSMYEHLRDDMIMELEDSEAIMITGSVLAQITRLRQILIAPQLVDPNCGVIGAGLEYIIDQAADLGHITIFTPFTKAFPMIEDALRNSSNATLKKRFKDGLSVSTLKGSMEPEDVEEQIGKFVRNRGIMICSILFAQSFNLETCSHGFFLGCVHEPDKNRQAESRLRRRTSPGPVTIQYILCPGTIDDEILLILDDKTINLNLFLRTTQGLKKLLGVKL